MTNQRGIGDVILRRYKETDTQFATREFNYCMWQVGHCHELQYERVRMGWHEPAIFYQQQAAKWYERAVECRARHDQALAELIPGTQVRWDEIFTIRYVQMFGRGQRIGPSSVLYVGIDTGWNDVFALVLPTELIDGDISASKIISASPHLFEPMFRNEKEALDNAALKLQLSSAYGKWKTVPDPRARVKHRKKNTTTRATCR